MPLELPQRADQLRLEAADIDAVGLLEQPVWRQPRQTGGRRDADRAKLVFLVQVDVAVVIQAGFALDLEQRRLAHAGQGVAVVGAGDGARDGQLLGRLD